MSTLVHDPNHAAIRLRLKKRVTAALNLSGPMNPLTLASCKRADKRDRADGFDYTDERGEHSFFERDLLFEQRNGAYRLGVTVCWCSNFRNGHGRYDEARMDARQMEFEIAAALTRAGFKVEVTQSGCTVWADENEGR